MKIKENLKKIVSAVLTASMLIGVSPMIAPITTYAAHLEGKHSYDEENLTNPCAFLIGNEGKGLRREIADMADCYIKIPMLGQVESLNAAIASSVLMFEAARQRRKAD